MADTSEQQDPIENSPLITVRNLVKEFSDFETGGIRAVDDISFDIFPGEIFGLLGPNGAGKTTCLRMLSTVLTPTGGEAIVAGYNVTRHPAKVRSTIGFLSGNTGLYDRMTAWEMVEYFGKLYGIPDEELNTKLESTFDTLQMQDFRDLLCSKMSTGMKQKVSIARTIIHDPPVLIFDEPTSGLDVLVAREVLKMIDSLRDQGKAIIFSTHIMREVEKLCDRVGIVYKGKLLALGTLEELQDQHKENDMEELFFSLISQHEEELLKQKTEAAGQSQ